MSGFEKHDFHAILSINHNTTGEDRKSLVQIAEEPGHINSKVVGRGSREYILKQEVRR